MPGFDLKQVSRNDQAVVGAGALGLIFSFLPWYQASFNGGGLFHVSRSYNAWQGFGILGVLLLLAAAAAVAAQDFLGVKLPPMPMGWNVIVAAASALGTLLILLEWLIFDPLNGAHGAGLSQGLAWGGYIYLI